MRQTLGREDSPEEIAACLACTKPPCACNHCTGPVVTQARPRKPPCRHKGFPMEVRSRALALVFSGMKIEFAAREAGVSESTLFRWLRDWREDEA